MSLNKLWITDLEVITDPRELEEEDRENIRMGEERWPYPPLHEEETAFQRMQKNIQVLRADGARTNGDVPIGGVSGFDVSAEPDQPDIINPAMLLPTGTLRLLWWGSPHPNPSSGGTLRHGTRITGVDCKNNAFEAMQWLCPQGTVAMTFPDRYPVELLQPRALNEDSEKTLFCGRMYSRNYIPMASGSGRRYTIGGADRSNTMLAMQVAPMHINCVSWVGSRLDFSTTMKRIMATFGETDFAVALGVYDCSLEIELLLID